MINDLRYTLRELRRSPGFTAAAILSLALGIGANTAIFSLTNAIVLRHLPVREADRLVVMTMKRPDGFGNGGVSHWLYQQIRDHNSVFSSFAAVSGPMLMTLSRSDGAEQVEGEIVTGNYFDTLGIGAIAGRALTAEDDRVPGAHSVCAISYGFWLTGFGGDASIIGRTLLLDRHAITVVGVTPKGFRGT
jgi:putative ABC transport system permease protein